MKQQFFLTFLLLWIVIHSFSQQYSYDSFKDYSVVKEDVIQQENLIQGYFIVLKKDAPSQLENSYKIVVLDEDLNEVSQQEFTAGEGVEIEEVLITSSAIIVKDYKPNGNELAFTTHKITKENGLEQIHEETIVDSKFLSSAMHAVNPSSFLSVYGTDKHHALVNVYTDGELQWTYKTPEDIKWEELNYITTYNNKLLFLVYRHNPVTLGGDYFIKAFSINNGQQLFEQVLTDFGYDHKITQGFINPLQKEIWVTGDYFDKGEDEKMQNSNGLFIMKISPQGDILDTDYAPWDGKINRYTKSYKKGKIKDGFVHIHDFIFLGEGKVFGIGEQYRKSFRALGLAEAALTAGGYGRLSKAEIGDLLLFKFSHNGKLLETKRNRKPQKTALINKGFYGGLFVPGKGIGEVLADQKEFDFSHFSQSEDQQQFTIFYNAKEELTRKQQKAYKRGNRVILKTVTYSNGNYDKNRYYLTDGKTEKEIVVFPAKPSFIAVSERSDEFNGLRLQELD